MENDNVLNTEDYVNTSEVVQVLIKEETLMLEDPDFEEYENYSKPVEDTFSVTKELSGVGTMVTVIKEECVQDKIESIHSMEEMLKKEPVSCEITTEALRESSLEVNYGPISLKEELGIFNTVADDQDLHSRMQHQCNVCSRNFSYAGYLRRHMRCHMDEQYKTKLKTLRNYYIRKKRDMRMPTGSATYRRSRKSDRFPRSKILDSRTKVRKTLSNVTAPVLTESEGNSPAQEEIPSDLSSLADTEELVLEEPENPNGSGSREQAEENVICPPPCSKKAKISKAKNRQQLLQDYNKLYMERMELIKDMKTSSVSHPDPIEDFFQGIITTVKTLPPLLLLQAKRRISNVVFDIELQALYEHNPPDKLFTPSPEFSFVSHDVSSASETTSNQDTSTRNCVLS